MGTVTARQSPVNGHTALRPRKKRAVAAPDAPPPHDATAEQAVLGAALLDQDAAASVVKALRPTDFYDGRHQTIFAAMLDLARRGAGIDRVTLESALRIAGRLDDTGGSSFLLELLDACPAPTNVMYYAEIVRGLADRRRTFVAGQLLQTGHPKDEERARALLAEAARPEIPADTPSGPAPDLADLPAVLGP